VSVSESATVANAGTENSRTVASYGVASVSRTYPAR
jgi:hypothetical protein